jgi:hypothetical protein
LNYDAQDNDTGVRYVQLRVDGQQVAQNDYLAKCSYTVFQPCPASESDTISWNTATVADGQHNLEAAQPRSVENAAQNTAIIHDATITTQNSTASISSLGALPGPGTSSSAAGAVAGYTASTGAANGTNASENAQLRLGERPTIYAPSRTARSS